MFDDEFEHTCLFCEEKEDKLKEAKYWCKAVLQQIFSNESLDLSDLERCLLELAGYLDVPFPLQKINIQRTESINNKIEFIPREAISEWLEFNNQYLNQLKPRAY